MNLLLASALSQITTNLVADNLQEIPLASLLKVLNSSARVPICLLSVVSRL